MDRWPILEEVMDVVKRGVMSMKRVCKHWSILIISLSNALFLSNTLSSSTFACFVQGFGFVYVVHWYATIPNQETQETQNVRIPMAIIKLFKNFEL
jgi:hypothetical protein